MIKQMFRFLPALLVLFLLCSTVQATNLEITVQDALENATISQATVFLDGLNIGRTTSGGTFLLTHDGDEDLDLRITRSGYEDWEDTVDRDITTILVNLTRKSLFLKVRLYDSDSLLPVADADVKLTLDNISWQKKSDSNGFASFSVTANTLYDLVVSSPDFQSQMSRSIEIGTDDKEVQYWLMRTDRFSFVVTDGNNNPVEGARIYLDSILKGTTDARGILILQVERDMPYVIEVKTDGYQEYLERRTIGTDEALVSIRISKVSIGAFVSVYDENRSPVEEAAVYLDNTVAGYTDKYGKYVFGNITTGTYQLQIRKDGYGAVEQAITITKQGDEFSLELPFDLTDLTIFVLDNDQKIVSGAHVIVNGNDLGLSSDSGQVATRIKYNTATNITARKEGYQTTSVQKTVIIGNTTSSATLIMEKNSDWGFIGLVVVGLIGILIIFGVIKHRSNKPGRHIRRRNEI